MNAIDGYLADRGAVKRTLAMLSFFAALTVYSSVYWQAIAGTPLGGYVEGGSQDIRQAAESFSGARYLLIPLYIYLRNSLVSVMTAVLGVTVLVPFSIIAFNSMIVGYVINYEVYAGVSPAVLTAALVPHGSIELPAIALSASIALYLPNALRGRGEGLSRVIARTLALSLTMLIFSAVIEAFITPIAAIVTLIVTGA